MIRNINYILLKFTSTDANFFEKSNIFDVIKKSKKKIEEYCLKNSLEINEYLFEYNKTMDKEGFNSFDLEFGFVHIDLNNKLILNKYTNRYYTFLITKEDSNYEIYIKISNQFINKIVDENVSINSIDSICNSAILNLKKIGFNLNFNNSNIFLLNYSVNPNCNEKFRITCNEFDSIRSDRNSNLLNLLEGSKMVWPAKLINKNHNYEKSNYQINFKDFELFIYYISKPDGDFSRSYSINYFLNNNSMILEEYKHYHVYNNCNKSLDNYIEKKYTKAFKNIKKKNSRLNKKRIYMLSELLYLKYFCAQVLDFSIYKQFSIDTNWSIENEKLDMFKEVILN